MKSIEKRLGTGSIILLGAVLLILAFLNKDIEGGADNYSHFKIAKYAFRYPANFLDHWGKPVFTLLSAPFAQLGLTGMKVWNILLGLFAGYAGWRIACQLGYRNAWLAPVFIGFAPVYFIMAATAMTEVMFSAFLITSVWLCLQGKFAAGTVLISFIPLVRTEGFFILPFFLLGLILHRRYKIIPLLVTGFFVYSVAGFFHYHDFFWIWNQNPYTGAKNIYGNGSLFHFITRYDEILGLPLTLLFLAGTVSLIWSLFRSRKQDIIPADNELLFLFFPAAGFLLLHSYLWWQGAGGSLGLTRVLASVSPLASLLALRGLNGIASFLEKHKPVYRLFLLLITLWCITIPFRLYSFPVEYSPAQLAVKQSSEWLKANGFAGRKIYYFDPLYFYFLNKDPYDTRQCMQTLPDREDPLEEVRHGELVLWDAHFGPYEGQTPLKKLMHNKGYRLIKTFRPEHPFRVRNDAPYEIHFFERVTDNSGGSKNILLKHYAFETDTAIRSDHRTSRYSRTGSFAMRLDTAWSFSPEIRIPYHDLQSPGILGLRAELYFFPPENAAEYPCSFVFSFEENGKAIKYFGNDLDTKTIKPGEWNHLTIEQDIPSGLPLGSYLKCYFWYRGSQKIYIDDLKVELIRTF